MNGICCDFIPVVFAMNGATIKFSEFPKNLGKPKHSKSPKLPEFHLRQRNLEHSRNLSQTYFAVFAWVFPDSL